MKMTRPEDDRKLLEWLRRGDPADGGPPVAARDLARMRQAILAQVEGGQASTPWIEWRWALVLACVLLLALSAWQLHDGAVRPSSAPRIAATQANPPAVETPVRGTDPETVVEVDEVAVVSETDEAAEQSLVEPEVAVASVDARRNPRQRTLRFTTSRGTQIIWIIDPQLKL